MTGDITCRQVVEIVTDYLEEELDARDRLRLEQHLILCTGCSAYVDQMRLAISLTRSLGADELRLQSRDEVIDGLLARPERRHVIAHKFLGDGAVGRFSGHAWPAAARDEPGDWVEVEGPLELCANGIHACTSRALSGWLDEQLWAVELSGEVHEIEGMFLARRGRLVGRVEEWPEGAAAEFARACSDRAEELARHLPDDSTAAGYAADAGRFARRRTLAGATLAAYAAALAAEAVEPNGFVAERRRQGEWLATRLGLEPTNLDRP